MRPPSSSCSLCSRAGTQLGLSPQTVYPVFIITVCHLVAESGESEAPSFLVQPVFQGRNPAGSLSTDSVSSLVDVEQLSSVEEVAKALIEFLVTRCVF